MKCLKSCYKINFEGFEKMYLMKNIHLDVIWPM